MSRFCFHDVGAISSSLLLHPSSPIWNGDVLLEVKQPSCYREVPMRREARSCGWWHRRI